MARVVVIGAGIAGLSAAIHAVANGHHVVVLEKRATIGGRATSQNVDGFSLHYGPHLIDNRGPFFKMCKRLSRVKPQVKAIRLDKVEVAGYGPVRPVGNIKQAAVNRRALKEKAQGNPYFDAIRYLSTWGITDNKLRIDSLVKAKFSVCNEGWIGLIGRLGAALDEVGVLIETGCEAMSLDGQKISLKDGRELECDAIILACGAAAAKRILLTVDEATANSYFSNLTTHFASSIEAGLSSKPMAGKHSIVDVKKRIAIIDYTAIQPKLGANGSHISAICTDNLGEGRFDRLTDALNHHISGWHKHIITDVKQQKIVVGYDNCLDFDAFTNHRVLLAGPWVKSDYILADAAADTGKSAAKAIKSLLK